MKRYAWFFATVAAASLALFALASSMAAPQQKFVLRVNAGDEKPYKVKAGNVWQVDKEYKKGGGYGFLGGDIVDRGADMKIAGATDPRIYKTEHYSIIQREIPVPKHPQGGKSQEFINMLKASDYIFVAGEAASHCVLETVEDLVEEFGDQPEMLRRLHVLRDCTSPVRHPQIDFEAITRQRFAEFAARGVRFLNSTDPMPF